MKSVCKMVYLVLLLTLASSHMVFAQTQTADQFLESAHARPVEDQIEVNKYLSVARRLDTASRAEVEQVLPSILEHTRAIYSLHVRGYAIGFLISIAIRPDAKDLLAPKSQEISALVTDGTPAIQQSAILIAGIMYTTPSTVREPYRNALATGIADPKVPQEVRAEIAAPLLAYSGGDPRGVASVLAFLRQSDLTSATRIELLHSLSGGQENDDVAKSLTKMLDDSDPKVRAAAVVAFSNSTSSFHSMARSRVEAMAKDPNEHAQVRQLAKDALTGVSPLNPNIDVPADKTKVP